MKRQWSIDFETNNYEDDCRVWGFGCCNIYNVDEIYYGDTIEEAMLLMAELGGVFYFHNLKFDGNFIVSYLMQQGYQFKRAKKVNPGEFMAIISDMNQWYSMKIGFDETVEIRDSLKVLPMKVKEVAKAFHLEEGKGEIDYNLYRPVGYKMSEEEKDYIRRDVQIIAKALFILFSQGMRKLTQASNAFSDYKKMMGKKLFDVYFPKLEYDADIRRGYRGGFVYANPKYVGKDIGKGIVLDVNSLYPYVLAYMMLPYGEGKLFHEQYQYDAEYPLYVQCITFTAMLKEGYVPTIQLKNSGRYAPAQYLEQIDEPEELWVTHLDLELMQKHYDVVIHEWKGGWKFRQSNKLFYDYVMKWTKEKTEATLEKNGGRRTIAKLMQNALYGRFGLNPCVRSKYPVLEDGKVIYKATEKEYREPVYIPVAVYTTSWARYLTICAAQQNYARFLYADTDSLHLLGKKLPETLEVDNVKLGAWKLELEFEKARYLRSKSYLELEYVSEEEMEARIEKETPAHLFVPEGRGFLYKKITCAGLPEQCFSQVTWDNFHVGVEYTGKLQQRVVDGGVVLKETTFKII